MDVLGQPPLDPLELLGVEAELDDVERLRGAGELRVNGLVRAVGQALEEVGEPAPGAVREVGLVDDLRLAGADRVLGVAASLPLVEVLVVVREHVRDALAAVDESRQVSGLVLVPLLQDDPPVRVVQVRPRELAALDAELELRQVRVVQGTDIRVAADTARFGVQEVKWALYPLGGSSVRLPRQLPEAIAMELLLTGDLLDAATCQRYGFVNHVVPPDQVMAKALEIAEKIAANGPLAVKAIKAGAREAMGRPEREAMDVELKWGGPVFRTEDAVEGPRAFMEKRAPCVQGSLTSRSADGGPRPARRLGGPNWPDGWAGRPGRGQRTALLVAGGALHADHGPLVQLGDGPGAGVGAGAADAGDDLVDDVLDARPLGIDVHPRGADALLEQLLAGPVELGLLAGAVLAPRGATPCRSSPCRAGRRCRAARRPRSRTCRPATSRTSRSTRRPPGPARRPAGSGRRRRPTTWLARAGAPRPRTRARRRTAAGRRRSSSGWCTWRPGRRRP